jgi:hypothetical protein
MKQMESQRKKIWRWARIVKELDRMSKQIKVSDEQNLELR